MVESGKMVELQKEAAEPVEKSTLATILPRRSAVGLHQPVESISAALSNARLAQSEYHRTAQAAQQGTDIARNMAAHGLSEGLHSPAFATRLTAHLELALARP